MYLHFCPFLCASSGSPVHCLLKTTIWCFNKYLRNLR
jgi:hypothetical protein